MRSSFVIVALSFSACTGAKYAEDVRPGTVASSSSDDASGGEDGSAGDDTGAAMVGISIDSIPGSACANAEQAWPLQRRTGSDWSNQTVFLATEMIPTGPWGVAVADFDGDGFPDVYLPQIGQSQLYRNDGVGDLVEVSDTKLPRVGGTGMAATAVDINGDGALDIVETGFGQIRLLMNDGSGAFSLGQGIVSDGLTLYYGSAWADMDGDGDLDGIISAFPGQIPSLEERESSDFLMGARDILLENSADGLMDASHKLPDTNDGHTFLSAWQDMDGDAQPELLVMNDYFFSGRTNRVWQFNGAVFEDVSTAYGLDQGMESMGLGITDANGDSLPDLLISGWGELAYMVSDAAGGAYISSAVARGFAPADPESQWVGWAVEYADLDNSGREEALVAFGHWELFDADDSPESPNPLEQADALFVGNEAGVQDRAVAWNFADQTSGRGMAIADLNRDGHPDVVRRPVFSEATIDAPQCTGAPWVSIALRQEGYNRFAIGARVTVEAGGVSHVRWIRAGGTGLSSGGPPEVHVGLGGAEAVDQITIQWPDGEVSIVEAPPIRHHLVMTR